MSDNVIFTFTSTPSNLPSLFCLYMIKLCNVSVNFARVFNNANRHNKTQTASFF
jgi:hypothetical protein